MTNCLVDRYKDYAEFHTETEKLDDTKFLAAFTTRENGKETYVVVRKT